MDGEKRYLDRTRDLVDEVLRTGLALEDVITSLLEDLPEGAFPGEDNGEVLLEMVAGSVTPAVAEAGERDTCTTIGLVAAIRERVLADLRVAARAHDRALGLARTIADLAGRSRIGAEEMSEALQLRRREDV